MINFKCRAALAHPTHVSHKSKLRSKRIHITVAHSTTCLRPLPFGYRGASRLECPSRFSPGTCRVRSSLSLPACVQRSDALCREQLGGIACTERAACYLGGHLLDTLSVEAPLAVRAVRHRVTGAGSVASETRAERRRLQSCCGSRGRGGGLKWWHGLHVRLPHSPLHRLVRLVKRGIGCPMSKCRGVKVGATGDSLQSTLDGLLCLRATALSLLSVRWPYRRPANMWSL